VGFCPRPEGHIDGDLGFFDALSIDGSRWVARATQCGNKSYTARDNLLYLVDDASTLTVGGLH
jgi:hypothetical protein